MDLNIKSSYLLEKIKDMNKLTNSNNELSKLKEEWWNSSKHKNIAIIPKNISYNNSSLPLYYVQKTDFPINDLTFSFSYDDIIKKCTNENCLYEKEHIDNYVECIKEILSIVENTEPTNISFISHPNAISSDCSPIVIANTNNKKHSYIFTSSLEYVLFLQTLGF